jgi:hypothetical protein
MMMRGYIYELVCIPTGEVIEINDLQLYNLYENDLIDIDNRRAIWTFKEEDTEKVKRYIKF